jgi:hypothetical protein
MNEELQHSEELAQHFAPYRDEAPLLTTQDVEQLLATRSKLPNRSRILSIRRLFMTLTAVSILSIVYFGWFSGQAERSDLTSRIASHQQQIARAILADTTKPRKQSIAQIRVNPKTSDRPWAAPADQVYADLTTQQLASIGLIIRGDTVFSYKLNDSNKIERVAQTLHSIGGGGVVRSIPENVRSPRFYPALVTMSNGRGASYRIETANSRQWTMLDNQEIENQFVEWLKKPGTPGYMALGFMTNSSRHEDSNGVIVQKDSIVLKVGKDLPAPRLFPLQPPDLRDYPDSLKKAVMELARYYEGSIAAKPAIVFPLTLTFSVDTVTSADLIEEMDHEQNGSTMQHMRSIMARLNELVPVIVRMHGGSGAPKDDDFIFWYEPSEELFAALPPLQATAFRSKLNQAPHCLTVPNAVLTSVDITYCVSSPQTVHLTLQDLTGKERISYDQEAVAGDNVWKVTTETLGSGMYLATVTDAEGNRRARRIWIENAHPKKVGWEMEKMMKEHPEGIQSWVSYDDDSVVDEGKRAVLTIPHLELDDAALARIGVQSDDSIGAFYLEQKYPGNVNAVALLRKWDPKASVYKPNFIQTGGTRQLFLKHPDLGNIIPQTYQPLLVTSGTGRKRLFTSNSVIINSTVDDSVAVKRKFDEIDAKFKDVDQLVPILLREDRTSDSVSSRDLIFWYQPTPELLEALPENSRDLVKQIAGVSDPGQHASVKEVQGAIHKAVAYPNPSKGMFSLNLSMDTKRELTFTVRNLLGQELTHSAANVAGGTSSQSLDLTRLADGVYLLDITSDAGERSVHRIVIAR